MLNFNIEVTPEGTLVISNDRTRIVILPEGDIRLSSADPVHLTGDCLAKLDLARVGNDSPYADALRRRLDKKK